ncbi:MAG: MBL fold metallo-hydrolase [Dehalococcoidia bacterium]|nr:MBL fold metallo-hydrolase [Dehalococcoidia bacterium]
MEITWLGRTCFRIKGREGTVVTDPCPPESGYQLSKLTADVVTCSQRTDPGYRYTKAVSGEPFLLDAPGEYEVGGILVTGIATKGPDGERNVAFVIELEGMRIAHLGLLASAGAGQLDDFKGVDVLLLPVGSGNSIGGAASADVMTTIDPKIAIPMNYRTEVETMETLDPLERFLKETGLKPEPEPKLAVSRTGLPANLTLRILEARA